MKRTFILKLAKRFYQYGAPSHRFEHHLTQVAEALKVEAEFILLPALIMVSFGGENYKSNTHFIKVSGGINMAKLAQVNALCLTLTQGLIDVENAMDLLEGIRVANDYSWWQVLLTYPVSSFTIGLLLFRLSWLESSIAGGLGLVVGTMSLAADKHTGFVFLLEFVGSLVVSFTSRALQGILHNVCFDYVKVALAALAVFLPGLSLTISIIELSTRNMVSGTVRLFSALFIAMLLGFGMTIGSALVLWETSAPTNPTCEPPSLYWAFLFFLPMAMATNISFQGSKHQWAVMTLAAALGFVFNTLLNLIPGLAAQPTAVTALSAISIGLTGNIYARITNDVAVAPILAGILLQVPGGLGVKSTLGFFAGVTEGSSANIVNGVNFTFQMLTIAMSLAMGLFVATLMVWPIRGPKSKYLTI
ncbi:hypothetical protein BC830DRAFT_1058236 [Chytriomyces sp. MP71]|nr:hypothetical protein BC830DRAFT_1058236 [Chytriomyces sp. MP71]